MNDKGQRGSRKGVPDGFGGRRAEVDAIRSETRQAARDAVAVLSQRGVIGPEAEDEKGPAPILEGEQQRETVETAFAKTLDPTMSDRARVKALRLVLKLIDDKKQNLPQETTTPQ